MKKLRIAHVAASVVSGTVLGAALPPSAVVPAFIAMFLVVIALAWAVIIQAGGVSLQPRPSLFFFGPLKPLKTITSSPWLKALWLVVAFMPGLAAGAFWAVCAQQGTPADGYAAAEFGR